MPRYNTRFELDIDDMDHIQSALLARKKDLSLKRIALLSAEGDVTGDLAAIDEDLAEIHDLLGRLHNQKVFYRPKAGQPAPYISG